MESELPGGSMATAMVVDDAIEVRQVVAQILRRQGFVVLEAAGIAESTRLAEENQYRLDLLVVNHLLADGIGRQAVEKIVARLPDIKVLRYSGYPMEYLIESGALRPGAAFLQKPFRASELLAKVHELLGWLPERQRRVGGQD